MALLLNTLVSSIVDYAGIKIYDGRDVVIKNNIIDDAFLEFIHSMALIVPLKTIL
jgi:hypothetical protein